MGDRLWFWSYGFSTTCAICAYHNYNCEFESRGVLYTTLCYKVCQWVGYDLQ